MRRPASTILRTSELGERYRTNATDGDDLPSDGNYGAGMNGDDAPSKTKRADAARARRLAADVIHDVEAHRRLLDFAAALDAEADALEPSVPLAARAQAAQVHVQVQQQQQQQGPPSNGDNEDK